MAKGCMLGRQANGIEFRVPIALASVAPPIVSHLLLL